MDEKIVADALSAASAAKTLSVKAKDLLAHAKRMESAASALTAIGKIRDMLPKARQIAFYNASNDRIGIVELSFLKDNKLISAGRQAHYANAMAELQMEYIKELINAQYDELRRMGGDL